MRSITDKIRLTILLVVSGIAIFPLPGLAGSSQNSGIVVTSPKVRTVLFYTEGWEFSLPVLELGSSQRLVFKFDELSANPKSYQYSLTHCDADWNPSRVVTAEYMEGFPENPVTDFAASMNTTIPFVNYRLSLPNENVKILLSGNYLLKVWEGSDRNDPVIVRPFYVTEKLVDIDGIIQKATYEGYSGESQQLAFTVNHQRLNIADPLNEIKVVVFQNGDRNTKLSRLKPTFIRQNQLVYEEKSNLFRGGNEFRNFNAKNLQTNGMGVKSIEYRDPFYHLFLEKDFSIRREMYHARDDLNGNFLVKNDRMADADLESDYTWVHFSLDPPGGVTDDRIFVYGALSDWQCTPSCQMNYNPETKQYEAAILLKQGFYDYEYVVAGKDDMPDATHVEGNHMETENNYHFFVYYRGFSSRWDRLAGYRMINSVKR